MKKLLFQHRSGRWELGDRVLLMGVLNVTPDSFSDGGDFLDLQSAVAHGLEMVDQGADCIDVGGESTRPGADAVAVEAEIERVVPVIRQLCSATDVPISVDTSKAPVARAAVAAGASIINDVSGLLRDPEMIEVVGEARAGCILMHMRGVPGDMQRRTDYGDLIGEIASFLERQVWDAVRRTGLGAGHFMVDPGIGFAKTWEQNLELVANTRAFRRLGRPVLMGPSRKSFIGMVTGKELPSDRLWGTAGAVAACVLCGADVVRVHDVAEMKDVAAVAAAVRNAGAWHPGVGAV